MKRPHWDYTKITQGDLGRELANPDFVDYAKYLEAQIKKILEIGSAAVRHEAAPAHNTGSPKLPLKSEVEAKVLSMWEVCQDTDRGTLLTGAQIAYNFIERQLRAGA